MTHLFDTYNAANSELISAFGTTLLEWISQNSREFETKVEVLKKDHAKEMAAIKKEHAKELATVKKELKDTVNAVKKVKLALKDWGDFEDLNPASKKKKKMTTPTSTPTRAEGEMVAVSSSRLTSPVMSPNAAATAPDSNVEHDYLLS